MNANKLLIPRRPEEYMRLALSLALQGQGQVEPNPMVGCVLVKNNRIVGQGYHPYFGGSHAEIQAIKQAGQHACGATAYVTLEPCNHFGKTGPCTQAILAAGIKRVVYAINDPNPLIAGKSAKELRRAGIQVSCGLLEANAIELNQPYLKLVQQKLPYVIAKWAQSLDGKIATRTGDSRWISGKAARRVVHTIRGRVDAIIVGSGTILRDDPKLTCRLAKVSRQACRVILDTRLRTPIDAHAVKTARKIPTFIFTSEASSQNRQARRLHAAGVEIQSVKLRHKRVSLLAVLKQLGKWQMSNVLLEGGGQLLGSAFDEDLMDEAYVFIAPKLIGGQTAPSPLGGLGPTEMKQARPLSICQVQTLGPDLLYHFKMPHSFGR